MKFNCGLAEHEEFIRAQTWHRWFAWYPVRVGKHECRWLEMVERRKVPFMGLNDPYYGFADVEYRALQTVITMPPGG